MPTDGLEGERTIQVIADPNNFIVESNENDNRAIKPLIVGAPPAANLVMLSSNVEFMPDEPQDGNLVTIQRDRAQQRQRRRDRCRRPHRGHHDAGCARTHRQTASHRRAGSRRVGHGPSHL